MSGGAGDLVEQRLFGRRLQQSRERLQRLLVLAIERSGLRVERHQQREDLVDQRTERRRVRFDGINLGLIPRHSHSGERLIRRSQLLQHVDGDSCPRDDFLNVGVRMLTVVLDINACGHDRTLSPSDESEPRNRRMAVAKSGRIVAEGFEESPNRF